MSLDNFQMANTLVVELYKDSLIDLDEKQNVPESLNIATPTFFGEYRKNILITVTDPHAVHLSDEPMKLLTAILNACELNFADVAVMNLYHQKSANLVAIGSELNPKVIINFSEVSLPFIEIASPQKYEVYRQGNKVALWSSSLTELPQDDQQKKQLWKCLLQIFPKNKTS